MILAAGNGTTFWYLTRGSGVVALILLTAAVVVGIVNALRWRNDRWPRFALTDAHRNLTLVAIAFVTLHVVTTVADGYAPIGLLDAVVPFRSPYRPLWLGLGAVSFDLLLALVVTSLMRGSIPPRLWRGLHWLAYAAWPIALVHSLGTGSDARTSWLQALGIGSLLLVAAAVLARIAVGGGLRVARFGGAAAAVAVPLALIVWDHGGPTRKGWARRAGTPTSILARKHIRVVRATIPKPPTSFTSAVSGSVSTDMGGDGLATVAISLQLSDGPRGAARIDLRGIPSDGGVQMTAGGVSFVPATTGSVYTGRIVSLAGTDVGVSVRDASGHRLRLDFSLSIDTSSGSVSGTVSTV